MSAQLDYDEIKATIGTLMLRIRDRFPSSGLYDVCSQLRDLGDETKSVAERLGQPIWRVRLVSCGLLLIFTTALLVILSGYKAQKDVTLFSIVQTLDAGANLLILIGVSAIFLWSIEQRLRRRRAIQAINELRDLAHVVDMKQLTKDPDGVAKVTNPTKHSPKRTLDAFALGRYLDYCSEMLSLISKLGYLYVTKFHDVEATRAANELENLCTGLSRKVWQKIMIIRTQQGGLQS